MVTCKMSNLIRGINLFVLITFVCSAPAVKNSDAVAQQLAQLTHNEKINALTKELERLQEEMKNMKTGSETNAEVEPVKQHMVPANAKKHHSGDIQPDGVFLDEPVDVKSRALGWQPLRRNAKPAFGLGLNDPVDIRQEVLDTIEQHILNDLDAVKQYGIRPVNILEDLDRKTQNGRQ